MNDNKRQRAYWLSIALSILIWTLLTSCQPYGSPLEPWKNTPTAEAETPTIVTPTPQSTVAVTPEPPMRSIATCKGDPSGANYVYFKDQNDQLSFWIQEAEVTRKQYRACMAMNGCQTPKMPHAGINQGDDGAIPYISYEEAVKYATWAGGHLPTAPQWIAACQEFSGGSVKFITGDRKNLQLFDLTSSETATNTLVVCEDPRCSCTHDPIKRDNQSGVIGFRVVREKCEPLPTP